LPKEIKNKKCIIGFENVDNYHCFWYCLAYLFYGGRIDRLKNKVYEVITSNNKVYELFKHFYGEKPKDSYIGVSMMDFESLEHHFNINVNVYRYGKQRGIPEVNFAAVKPLTLMTTQSPHQTVFSRLSAMNRGKAINPLKTT
jgi:hypothetical protein